MSKKDQSQVDEQFSEQDELTEWQKRHIEFQQKQLERQEEREREEERYRRQKMAELTGQDFEEPEEDWVEEELIFEDHSQPSSFQEALPLLLFSGIVFIISLFMVSPFSKHKLFLVNGASNTADYQLVEAAGIKRQDYISQVFFNMTDHEKEMVKNAPWIKSARMTYEFPNRFLVNVEEHEVAAYNQTAQGWQPILGSGEAVDVINASQLPENFLAIYLDKEEQVKTFVQQLMTMDVELRASITDVSLANSPSTKDLLLINTIEGHLIRVPLSDLSLKLPYYQTIKTKLYEPSIIDMEVGIYATTAALEEAAAALKASRTPVEDRKTDDKEEDKKEEQAEARETTPAETVVQEVVAPEPVVELHSEWVEESVPASEAEEGQVLTEDYADNQIILETEEQAW